MSDKSQGFADRAWAVYYNEAGLYMFKARSGGEFGFGRRDAVHIRALSEADYMDDKTKQELVRAVGPQAEGVFMPVNREVPELLVSWRRKTRRERPVVFFKRTSFQGEPNAAIIAHTCYDALFLEEVLPPSYAEVFRNSREGVVAKDTAGVLPILDRIDAAYNNWRASKNIVLSTDRTFVYAAFMPTPDPEKFRISDLSRKRDENHPYGCVVVHSLGISSDDIRQLQNMGFVWNRSAGAWTANVSKIDKLALGSFITESSLPLPEERGFIPEWMASRSETKALGYIRRTGSFEYENTKHKEVYGELIRTLIKL